MKEKLAQKTPKIKSWESKVNLKVKVSFSSFNMRI